MKNRRVKLFFQGLGIWIFILCVYSCDKENEIDKLPIRSWTDGVFVVNEGAFNHSNASLGWYDFNTGNYLDHLYKSANENDLGDVFQGINFLQGRMMLTINNSNKVALINDESLIQERVFLDVNSPRKTIDVSQNKSYITSLKDNSITVWNHNLNKLIKRIAFPGWSEDILIFKGMAIVSNPSFYSGEPTNHIYIIDIEKDELVDSIEVLTSPGEMLIDKNDDLWVYCQGHFLSKLNGGLAKVDLLTFKMTKSFEFKDVNSGYASAFTKNTRGDSLFFLRKDVYKMSIDEDDLPENPFIVDNGRTFYGLAVDRDDQVWVSDAVDYIQKGVVSIYSSNGQLQKEFRAGVIPSKFYFR